MDPANDLTRNAFELPPGLSGLTTRYDILSETGRGGMGIVYKARDRQTGDIVAIKVLHPSIAGAPGLIDRFTNELLLARKITHKNVCRVHDLNELSGVTVISMEFVDGESLRDILRRAGGVSIRLGLKIMRQVIAGLGEAHAQGVVHRDLKPANILVSRDGSVKVMDFGIARSIDSQETSVGLIIGTPGYMSPEQAEGRQPDARSDVYSLGLVMYELFCGEPAFTADNTAALVTKQVHERPRSPLEVEPDLPRRIERAILKCLEKKPERRFQSVAELDAALSEEPVAPITTTAWEEAPLPLHLTRWQRSDWLLIATAAVGVSLFFFSFARTSLAPRSQVTFDRVLLQRIVQEHLQRLGAPSSRDQSVHVDWDMDSYIYVAKEHGAAAARELANNPVAYWQWHMLLQDDSAVAVNNRGELSSYSRTVVPADSKGPPREDAKAVAEKTLVDVWKQPSSGLDVERSSAGGQVNSFTWLNPKGPEGLLQRYSIVVDARGTSSFATFFSPPTGYKANVVRWGDPATFAITLILAVLGFLHRRRVDVTARWRVGLCALAFLATGSFAFFVWNFATLSDQLAVSFGFGLIGIFGWLLGSMALEVQIKATRAARLHSLVRLLGRRAASEPCGLSILRGTLIGLVVLGVDALATWLATTRFSGFLDPVLHIFIFGRTLNGARWPTVAVLAFALVQGLGIGLLIAFVVSVGERLVTRAWVRCVLAAVLLAGSSIHLSLGSVLPYYWTIGVLFLDYAILVLAFTWFDLLTLFVAIFTCALCGANYALFVMQQQIGPVGPVSVCVIWSLFVALAVTVVFQSTLRPAYRRIAASFE
jgi:serine/threonine protein kinase